MPPFPGFCGPFNAAPSWNTDVQQCWNWFPEPQDVQAAKSPLVLAPTPGMTRFGTLPMTPGRAFFEQNGRCFAVADTDLYELFADGSYVSLGTMLRDDYPATISSNGDAGHQLFITSGTRGYIYDLISGAFTYVLAGVTAGGFMDGFFLALDITTSTLKISNFYQGLLWDPTQIAQRGTSSDRWVAMQVVPPHIWLFGAQCTDGYYNNGGAPFPFAPDTAVYVQQGAGATFGSVKLGTTVGWLSRSSQGAGQVFILDGSAPKCVSTIAVESAIQGYGRFDDAIGWSYQQHGHVFYVLTFPTPGVTWVYDLTADQWHQRGLWSSDANAYLEYRPKYQAFAFGKLLTLDRQTGDVWALSQEIGTDVDGAGLRRQRICPHLSSEQKRIRYQALQIDMQTGIGLANGQGSDPVLSLRYSDDGGNNWSSSIERSAGKRGAYSTRVRWFPLGMGRDRVFDVSTSEPIPIWLQQAFLEFEVGAS